MAENWGTRNSIDQNYYYLPSTYNTDLATTFKANTDGTTVAASALIETSYDLVLHQDLSLRSNVKYFYVGKNSSLSVHGDRVIIRGRIEAPGQTIRIFCRELDVDPNGGDAAIVVDGKDGGEPGPLTGLPGTKGHDGKEGGKGGTIEIFCDRFTERAKLLLSANGGKGGDGQKGQDGGRGAKGPQGTRGWYKTVERPTDAELDEGKRAIQGRVGQDGGTGGEGGKAGLGGAGGRVSVATLEPRSSSSAELTTAVKGGDDGKPGEGGKRGEGGDGGEPGDGKLIYYVGLEFPTQNERPVPGLKGPSGSPGSPGSPGAKAPPTGAEWAEEALAQARRIRWLTHPGGSPDTYSYTYDQVAIFELHGFSVAGSMTRPPGSGDRSASMPHYWTYTNTREVTLQNMEKVCRELPRRGAGTAWIGSSKDLAKDRVLQFVHVSQLQMVFHKARMHYLAAGEALDGNRDELDKANVLLTWLDAVLDVVIATAAPESPVALQAHQLAKLVLKQRKNIDPARGLNYFGKAPDWVPRQSLAQYQEWLEGSLASQGSLASLKIIEDYHNELYSDLKTKTKLALNVANCDTVITTQKDILKGQKKRIKSELELAVAAIAAAETVVTNARTTASDAIGRYKERTDAVISFPPPTELFGMLEMIAFLPESGPLAAVMVGTQAGKFINAVATAKDELHTAGGPYKKEYVVHQLDGLGDEFKSLNDAIETSKKNPDALKPLDQRKLGLILTTKEKWDRVLDQYYSKDTSEAGKLVKTAMDYYVRQVLQRNDQVLEYNDLLQQWYDLNTKITGLDSQLWVGETKTAEAASPGLPMMMAFVDHLYERAKDQCLDDLYKAARAYAFWSLDNNFSLFRDLLRDHRPHEVNHAILVAGKNTVLKALRDARENLARPPQPRGAVMIRLGDYQPEVLETLKKTGVATFKLEPARKETRSTDPNKWKAAFHGMADVRLTKLRAWADGLPVGGNEAGKGLHTIVLTHLGDDTLVTAQNNERKFSHVPVETTIIYWAASMPNEGSDPGNDAVDLTKHNGVQDGNIKDLEELEKKVFSQIGPFGKWQIEIPARDNFDVDLSTLKNVRIDFYCTNHTLAR